jgi:hypothetical protein
MIRHRYFALAHLCHRLGQIAIPMDRVPRQIQMRIDHQPRRRRM